MVVKVWIDVNRELRHQLMPAFMQGVCDIDAAGYRQQFAESADDSARGLAALGWFFAHAVNGIDIDNEALLFVAERVFSTFYADDLNPFLLPWLSGLGVVLPARQKVDKTADSDDELAADVLWARAQGHSTIKLQAAADRGALWPAYDEAARLYKIRTGKALTGSGVHKRISRNSATSQKYAAASRFLVFDKEIKADWRLSALAPFGSHSGEQCPAEYNLLSSLANELSPPVFNSRLDLYLWYHRDGRLQCS